MKKYVSLFMGIILCLSCMNVSAPFRILAVGLVSYDEVKSELSSVTFEEDIYTILNPRVTASEKLQLQNQLGHYPSEEEIREYAVDRCDLRDSYDRVMSQLDTVMPNILATSNWGTEDIVSSKAQIILGLTYLDRYYSFEAGGRPVKDIMLFSMSDLGAEDVDGISFLMDLGLIKDGDIWNAGYGAGYIYENKICYYTGISELTDFIDKLAAIDGCASGEEYINKVSNATIYEIGENASLFNKAKSNENIKRMLLPLMNLSGNSVYVLSTDYTTCIGLTATYSNRTDMTLEERLEKTAEKQNAYLDFWSRISTNAVLLGVDGDTIVTDTLSVNRAIGGSYKDSWSPLYGELADIGVKEFIKPLGYYKYYQFVGAERSSSTLVRYWVDEILSDSGVATYTHELTHIYEGTVWLNNYGKRNGTHTETYARGLFESFNNSQVSGAAYGPIFGLNMSYELADDVNRVQNSSPARFQNTGDIYEYMHGVMDVIYTLDALEAQEILKLSDEDKAIMFNKVSLVDDGNGNMNDRFQNITVDEASLLKNVDDLADYGMVSGRLVPSGNSTIQDVLYDDYVVIPLFEGIYGGLQNEKGTSGGFLFRRYGYELLAEYGWENGMVKWASGVYENDTEALNGILDSEYGGSINEFKKSMLNERIDNMDRLRGTATYKDVEAMRTAMANAVLKDLSYMKGEGYNQGTYYVSTRNVRNLKMQIFMEYLAMTNDFEESIYEEENTDKPAPEEQKPGGATTEEEKPEEVTTEEEKPEEVTTEEQKPEEVTTEEQKPEEATTEEQKPEEATTEEEKPEEATTEEQKPEEATTEEHIHLYDEGVVDKKPTCEAAGIKVYTCIGCRDIKEESLSAEGHSVVVDKAVEATTVNTGLTEGAHCSVCKKVLKPQDIIPKKVTGWIKDCEGWKYVGVNGEFQRACWLKADERWYYMDETGIMATGWRNLGGVWYYMNETGAMVTGWRNLGGVWYYMNESGAMVTGWRNLGGVWYYMDETGAMVTGWRNLGGVWYYMDETGAMTTGWQKLGEEWYYMDETGAMTTGWQKINDNWYYMNQSGAMTVGWREINGKWYYMSESGIMAADTMIGGFYLDISGAWSSK